MMYCPPNVTFSEVWVSHGVSHCFLDTVTSATYGLFLLIFGIGQWIIYYKYASRTEEHIRPKSCLFNIQVALTVFIPVIAIVHLALLATLIGDATIYGYEWLHFAVAVVVWPFSLRLLLIERYYQLPTVPSNGHGFVLLFFWTIAFVAENLTFINLRSESWWFNLQNTSDTCEFAIFVARYVTMLLLFVIGIKAPGVAIDRQSISSQFSPLIDGEREQQNDSSSSGSTFRDAFRKLGILMPFMWPKNNLLLQLNVMFCVALLVCGRLVNVALPLYSKEIVNALGGSGGTPRFCWDLVATYGVLMYLGGSGNSGLLSICRDLAWIKVQQNTSREVQLSLFTHLHNLSLRWHLGKKTGEVLRVMDRGTASINSLLQYIVFRIIPVIVDLVVAIVFFSTAFNFIFGIIVFVTMSLYLMVTITITEWRTKYRRSMNLADNEQRTRGVDSLLNFETVKYYSAEAYEVDRLKNAIISYQKEEWKSMSSLSILNFLQNSVITAGFIVGALLCAYYVSHASHHLTVGDYVLFTAYIFQLYTPLNFFGTYYRMIQNNFIDMENMFDLLKENQEVQDEENAEDLCVVSGHLEFKNVCFGYGPDRRILNDVSFVVEPGKTLAIVGGTGEGKSTIIRLLFRFYDVCSGSVLVDGKDIRTVTQNSLRQSMGVVPQDTVLFNETIGYNIRYGRIISSPEEVEQAARNAEIHDKIMNFSDKYESKVGERGLKLSGGEKQRVAIARTMIKSPAVLLLDEATSALDTATERNIQTALNRVCSGRTVVMVAHRLSTVVGADSILVLKEGRVVEQGSHEELLCIANGVYADMWNKQLETTANGQSETTGQSEAAVQPEKEKTGKAES